MLWPRLQSQEMARPFLGGLLKTCFPSRLPLRAQSCVRAQCLITGSTSRYGLNVFFARRAPKKKNGKCWAGNMCLSEHGAVSQYIRILLKLNAHWVIFSNWRYAPNFFPKNKTKKKKQKRNKKRENRERARRVFTQHDDIERARWDWGSTLHWAAANRLHTSAGMAEGWTPAMMQRKQQDGTKSLR